jgi:glycosyltransferase involved in cell wall biosynthesis
MTKISYAIPVCNEYVELKQLLQFLEAHKRKEDEIVVLCDKGNTTDEVMTVLQRYKDLLVYDQNPLNKDFAQQKNYLTKMCTGDWVFLIDADEYPDQYLCTVLPDLIEGNPDVEAYWISRINTVEGLTQEHINKWRWNVNEKGWINFPDKQLRIYKNDPDRIKWTKPVHEQLVGYTKFASLPDDKEYCLYHPKDIQRQEIQNNFYDTIV